MTVMVLDVQYYWASLIAGLEYVMNGGLENGMEQ